MRATACGTGGDKLLGTLPRNENQACVDGKVPQEEKAKGKEQRERKGGRKEDTGRNGRELNAKVAELEQGMRTRGRLGSSGIGRWMAGLGELGPRARLRSAARSEALCGCLNIH